MHILLNRSKERNCKFERAFCDIPLITDQMKINWLLFFLLVFGASSCPISASPRCHFSAILLSLEYRICCLKYTAYFWKPQACNLSLIDVCKQIQMIQAMLWWNSQQDFQVYPLKNLCGYLALLGKLYTSEFIYPRESRRHKWKSCIGCNSWWLILKTLSSYPISVVASKQVLRGAAPQFNMN